MVVAGSTSVSTDQPSYSVELVVQVMTRDRSTTIDVVVVDETRDPTLATHVSAPTSKIVLQTV